MTSSKNDDTFQTNREILRDTHEKVTQMFHAMYGDKEGNIPGITHRVKKLEDKEGKRGGLYILISSISAGLALAAQSFLNHNK